MLINYYPLPHLIYLYEVHLSEGKIFKTKLLTQSKTESFFNRKSEHRNSKNNVNTQKDETQGTLWKGQDDKRSSTVDKCFRTISDDNMTS